MQILYLNLISFWLDSSVPSLKISVLGELAGLQGAAQEKYSLIEKVLKQTQTLEHGCKNVTFALTEQLRLNNARIHQMKKSISAEFTGLNDKARFQAAWLKAQLQKIFLHN